MNDLEYYKRRTSELEKECAKKQNRINNLEEENGRLQAQVDTYVNCILPRATKEAYEMLGKNQFAGIKIVTCEQFVEQRKKNAGERNKSFAEIIDKIYEYRDRTHEDMCSCNAAILEGEVKGLDYVLERIKDFTFGEPDLEELGNCKKEIKNLKEQIYRKETEISQIDNILNELLGLRHDAVETPEEFKKLLRDKINGNVGNDGYREKQKKTDDYYGIYAYYAEDLTKDNVLFLLGLLTKELVKNGIDFKFDVEDEIRVYDVDVPGLPKEPIEAADIIIRNFKQGTYPVYERNANGEVEQIEIDGKSYPVETGDYEKFEEVRQIAEHLLIYCNYNSEG